MGKLQIKTNQKLVLSSELLISTTEIISAVLSEEKSLPAVASKINDVAISKAGGGTQVSKLKRELGEKETRMIIASLIYDLRDTYNTKNEMSDSQVEMLVEIIITEYWHLKLEQIARAFHLQKLGKLIKIYDRFDIDTVIQVLNHYENKIALPEQQAEALGYKEQIEYRETSTGTKAAVTDLRNAVNRYLVEKELKSKDNAGK